MAAPALKSTWLHAASVARTHVGRVRTVNEDRLLDQPESGFWAIADGMGGMARGDVAADRLIRALAAVEHGPSGFARLADVDRAADRVNAELFAEGGGGMGATLVALLLHEGHFACLWAGDSRAYRLRDGLLQPLTRDHSHVQELVDAGVLAEAKLRRHPQSHVITRAIGVAAKVEVERCFDEVRAGDLFLLCSDGLTTCLDLGETAERLDPTDIAASADALIAAVLERGAPDNVSLVVAKAGA